MSLMNSKWLNKSADMFEVSAGGELLLKLAVDGAIESTASGFQIGSGSVVDDMLDADYVYADGSRSMTGALNMGSNLISNLASPVSAGDAATRQFVEDRINGIDRKASVRVATTEEITLSGLQTVDGVSLDAGDRVLVKNQDSDPSENGIYDVVDGGSWTRADDADGNPAGEVTTGMFTYVEEGTALQRTGWSLATTGEITVGTTELNFVQTSHVGEITTDGLGIVKSGNELSLVLGDGMDKSSGAVEFVLDGASLANSASGLKVAADGITEVEINSSALGNGLGGGSGAVLALAALTSDWDLGGSQTITGVPDPSASSDVANKAYVDTQIAEANNRAVELFTLDATDISNAYVDLAEVPGAGARVTIQVKGAPAQFYGDDFQITSDGSQDKRLTWAGLGLDGVLADGDKFTVTYDV